MHCVNFLMHALTH